MKIISYLIILNNNYNIKFKYYSEFEFELIINNYLYGEVTENGECSCNSRQYDKIIKH